MKSQTYPLAIPSALLAEIRETAEAAELSLADAMRQSLKLGLPKLREKLRTGRVTNVEPLSPRAARRLYAEPDEDEAAIRLFMAAQSKSVEE